jgi:hypothetical protein
MREYFCVNILAGLTPIRAIKDVIQTIGDRGNKELVLSDNSYSERGRAILKEVAVQKRLKFLRKKLTTSLVKAVRVDKQKIVQELALLAFSNLDDFIEIDDAGEYCLKSWNDIGRKKKAAVQTINITTTTTTKKGGEKIRKQNVRFTLASKQAALESLGKHLGIFQKDNEQKKPQQTIFDILAICGENPEQHITEAKRIKAEVTDADNAGGSVKPEAFELPE